MTPKVFAGLGIATAFSIVVAAGLYSANTSWSSGNATGEPVFPNLSTDINNVQSVKLVQGQNTFSFQRNGAQWSLKEKDNYPVRSEPVRRLLIQLAEARLIDKKTGSKEKHALLDLQDPTAKDSQARQISLLDGSSKQLADLILGKKRFDAFGTGKSGVYVRRANEDQTWLAQTEAAPEIQISDWVEIEFFKFPTGDISQLEINWSDDVPVKLVKKSEKESEFDFADLPEGQRLKKDVQANTVAEAFASLSLDDVKKAGDSTDSADTAIATLNAEGMTIFFRLQKQQGDSWLSVQAVAGGDASEEVRKTVADINTKASGWIFKLPKSKAEAMFKRKSDLFEKS